MLSSIQTHSCPSSDQLHHQADMAARLLSEFPQGSHMQTHMPQSSGVHQHQQPPMHQPSLPRKRPGSTGVNENKNTQPLTRPSTLQLGGLGSSKDDLLISPLCNIEDFGDFTSAKRAKFLDDSPLERPSSLSLTNWGQTPSLITPSSGMPRKFFKLKNVCTFHPYLFHPNACDNVINELLLEIVDLLKSTLPDEYSMLNQQTFLTPVVPSAVSVTSAAPPPSNSDLQTL